MKRLLSATVVSYLVVSMAEGSLALAQAPVPPVPPMPGARPAARRAGPLGALRAGRLEPPMPPAAAPGKVAPPPGSPAAAKAAAAKPGDPTAAAGVVEIPGEKEFNSCKKLPAGKRIVRLNLKPDTEVMDLIGWISSITCAQFIVSVPLQGKKLTIVSPQLITPEEAYRLFFSALDSLGLTVEPTGKFLRVVENAKARFTPLPIIGPNQRMPADRRYVTKLVRLTYLDSLDLTNNVLNRIKSETGDIIAYRNSIIMTDQSESIDRMVQIIKQFDTPSGSRDQIWVIRVKNMSVQDMASRIAEIMPVAFLGTGQRRAGGATPAQPKPTPGPSGELLTEMSITKLIPDERTNSLIVVANKAAHDWLVALVHKLDVPLEEAGRGSEGRFHVYYCANANCDELASTLSAITGVQISGSLATNRRGGAGRAAAASAPAAAPGQASPSALLFESDIRISFDAPTNSLLIMSTFKDFQSIRRVIEQLDSPRKQIFIDATIMEVLLDKTRTIGVSYHAGSGETVAGQPSLLMGGFNANQTMNPTALVNNLGGLSAALFGPTTGDLGTSTLFKGLPINIPSFGMFLQLLQTNNDVNILSNPHILIMNNQEGEISVGEVLPFPGTTTAAMGATTSGGVGYMPFTSVQRQPVELKLKLTPSVNEHDIIRLDVDQEISDVTSQDYNHMGPATSKRSVKTTVVARDQQTVVIGGLMADRISESVTKVPILGDIPVIGFFFRNTTKTVKKSNIIIAITPYVVSDLSDLRRVAEKKLRERREFIERFSSLEDTSKLDQLEIDTHRKRGMLEEINRSVREMEEDERQLQLIRERDQRDESEPIKWESAPEPESQNGNGDGKGNPSAHKATAKASKSDDVPPKPLSAAPDSELGLPRSDE
ncbi:MAG TPA: type II secretion system secretin GspD [Polyangia bacterium]